MALSNLAQKKEVKEEQKTIFDVVRSGEHILIPEACTIKVAIQMLQARQDYESQLVVLARTIECMPQEGALALHKVLTEKYGFAATGFGGEQEIESGFGKRTKMYWGDFPLPGMGTINTDWTFEKNKIVFRVVAKVPRMYEAKVQQIFAEVERVAREESIYRGQPLKVNFYDHEEQEWLKIPEITFMDPTGVKPEHAIYSRHIEEQLETNLYTPIQRAQDCLANGISVKRGVLLAGTYGTGKTLAAGVAQRLAWENGITYVYIEHAFQLAKAVIFARMYQSPAAVIFCEDIDRTVSGERNAKVDEVLNTVDGIDSKNTNIMVVLTTNELESITPAMLRPGRLDSVIEVTAPDAEAISRLIKLYGKDVLAPGEDVTEAAEVMAGKIPAVVAEVLKRAKLAQLAREKPGTRVLSITGAALAVSARSIVGQMELLARLEEARKPKTLPTLDDVVRNAVKQGVKRYSGTPETN